jgi:hypothetical protein
MGAKGTKGGSMIFLDPSSTTPREKNKKPAQTITAHRRGLQGTGFEGCAECSGASVALDDEGNMPCRRVRGEYVTPEQAQACEGVRPPLIPITRVSGNFVPDTREQMIMLRERFFRSS